MCMCVCVCVNVYVCVCVHVHVFVCACDVVVTFVNLWQEEMVEQTGRCVCSLTIECVLLV